VCTPRSIPTAPLADTINSTSKQHRPLPLVSTAGRHHWPGPLAACSKHVGNDNAIDVDDDVNDDDDDNELDADDDYDDDDDDYGNGDEGNGDDELKVQSDIIIDVFGTCCQRCCPMVQIIRSVQM